MWGGGGIRGRLTSYEQISAASSHPPSGHVGLPSRKAVTKQKVTGEISKASSRCSSRGVGVLPWRKGENTHPASDPDAEILFRVFRIQLRHFLGDALRRRARSHKKEAW